MNVPVRLDFRTVFKLDELFKRGDLLLDKRLERYFFIAQRFIEKIFSEVQITIELHIKVINTVWT